MGLKEELIKLAHDVPETRKHLVPLLKKAWGGSTSAYSMQIDKFAAEIQKQDGIKRAVVIDTWMESSNPPVVWAAIEIKPDIEKLTRRTQKIGVAATVVFKKAVKAALSRFKDMKFEKSSTPRQNFPRTGVMDTGELIKFYEKYPYRIEVLYYPEG